MKQSLNIPFKIYPKYPHPHPLWEIVAGRLTYFGNEWYHVPYCLGSLRLFAKIQ